MNPLIDDIRDNPAFSGARKNRLDVSVGIALGSASQIALFIAPTLVLRSYFVGPGTDGPAVLAGRRRYDAHRDLDDLAGHEQRTLGLVRRRAGINGLSDFRSDALPVAAPIPLKLIATR